VQLGTIRITNARGMIVTLDLAAERVETIGDVIDLINSATLPGGGDFGVRARINDTGDGIVLEDTTGGDGALEVRDESGTAAADLKIEGQSQDGVLDGSFEQRIEVIAGETLQDLVARINDSRLATASILNDGGITAPFRLQITSTRTGLAGEIIVDDEGLGLDLVTLARAQDAQIVFGPHPDTGLLISSASNTIADVVPGITLNLTGVSDDPVTVTVNRDSEGVVESIDALISAFNDAIDRIETLTDYDEETQTAAILLGDGTVRAVQSRLFRMFTGSVPGAPGGISRLAELGVRIENGRLSFDRNRFEQALAEDPDAVVEFFTDPTDGFAVRTEEALKQIAEADGLLQRREDSLERQKEVLNDRVEQLNDLLERKRRRLTRQFLAMERALAELQSQQAALAQMSVMLGNGFTLRSVGG